VRLVYSTKQLVLKVLIGVRTKITDEPRGDKNGFPVRRKRVLAASPNWWTLSQQELTMRKGRKGRKGRK